MNETLPASYFSQLRRKRRPMVVIDDQPVAVKKTDERPKEQPEAVAVQTESKSEPQAVEKPIETPVTTAKSGRAKKPKAIT